MASLMMGIDEADGRIVDDVVLSVDHAGRQIVARRVDHVPVLCALQIFQRRRGGLHGNDGIDKHVYLHGRHENEVERPHIDLADHGHGGKIERARDGDQQFPAFIHADGDKFMLAQESERDVFQQGFVHFQHIHFAIRQAEKFPPGRSAVTCVQYPFATI